LLTLETANEPLENVTTLLPDWEEEKGLEGGVIDVAEVSGAEEVVGVVGDEEVAEEPLLSEEADGSETPLPEDVVPAFSVVVVEFGSVDPVVTPSVFPASCVPPEASVPVVASADDVVTVSAPLPGPLVVSPSVPFPEFRNHTNPPISNNPSTNHTALPEDLLSGAG